MPRNLDMEKVMNLRKQLSKLTDWDKDDVLDLVGLETRRSTAESMLPALGAFGVGVLVGVGVGLLIAQKPGSELRDDLRARMNGGDNASSSLGGGAGEKSVPRSM